MRCGVAQPVARVGNAVPGLRCHGIGYLLARSSLYASFAVTYSINTAGALIFELVP